MKFPYTVVHDGVWYPAGTEVPTGETPSKTIEAPKTDESKTAEKTTAKRGRPSK